ncbi:related to cellulose-binding GDSL lipase/acylhydrolase [Cephalotrichum gorgonifer]|uniref:Related to cellulose-binding GDSL lipase/acylhydrolase n=1 Tax=Cephalotrichum gorgonifer TaxID=2041049 RepID=A0AAE8N7B1_9PEZI|nr:related to cellulose-binding GDSL lipase/acylhydrolase [Cephalotrichum gorgonifer]
MKLTTVASALTLAAGAMAAKSPPKHNSRNWKGWEKAKTAFIFGDSYTQTGFNVSLEQPNAANPLGNPAYPGWTSSNGPNWVGYLTTKYNATANLRTYNLADGGATVDSDLVAPWKPTVRSLVDQVTDGFLPNYGDRSAARWSPETTVFGIWIGINDVGNSFWSGRESNEVLYAKIFDVYRGLVDDLYGAGARNFVFLNVPAIQRSPLTLGQGEQAIALEIEALEQFNGLVDQLAGDLKAEKKKEVNVWVHDTFKAFTEILDDPASHAQTAGYKNVTGYCEEYQNGTPEWDTFIESCGYAVNEYFWLNSLHPTYPAQEVIAEGVAKLLRGPPNVV